MKLKKGLVKDYEEKKLFNKEQEQLKAKHEIVDENIVVVEKSGFYRFITDFFKAIVTIVVFCLVAVGIIALVYPNPREALLIVLQDCINQIMNFIGR